MFTYLLTLTLDAASVINKDGHRDESRVFPVDLLHLD